ncbi:MAG TPA: winged helix-turn-helix domain-containing protein [Solirubrobacteraceae bacterium]|nr:winged helix-turn-helix domain-containing protein [Solirubrobacteraceae bacterium]
MKQITEIDDARLVKGLAHPLRIAILRVLEERTASPSEIAEEIEAPLGNVSYHVRFLARLGLVELAGTRPRRGAVEHYYRAVARLQVSQEAWERVPLPVRDAVLSSTLHDVARSVGEAAAGGGFSHEKAQATHVQITLDPDGMSELSAAVQELHRRAVHIGRESRERLAVRASGDGQAAAGDTVDAALVLMLYGTGSVPTASEPERAVVPGAGGETL